MKSTYVEMTREDVTYVTIGLIDDFCRTVPWAQQHEQSHLTWDYIKYFRLLQTAKMTGLRRSFTKAVESRI